MSIRAQFVSTRSGGRLGIPLLLMALWMGVPTSVKAQSEGMAAGEIEVLTPARAAAEHPTFEEYWYQGLAELSRYRLEQSRYGEVHPGEAVLVFVTEDFRSDIQVKYEHGDRQDVVPILKLNAYRRFYTGIYPYTMLTSVFVPVAPLAPALKVSASVQEWCGHTYTQLNLRGDSYEAVLHSYFQDEADQALSIPAVTLEDEIWVRIRRAPDDLPLGPTDLVPGMHFLRLMHRPLRAYTAEASIQTVADSTEYDEPVRVYTVTYPELGRELRITFQERFPHQILAWEESYAALFNPAGGEPQRLTTRAVLTDSMLLDYWVHHDLDDAGYRDLLGLEF